LVTRGKCPFIQKIIYAQSLGAVAVVVGEEDKESGSLLTMFANRMRDRDLIEKVQSPAVFISGRSRNDLERLWKEEGKVIDKSHTENGELRGLKVTMNQDDVWTW
jgi:6-phosphofructokinase